jgi:ketosteroid isomerase-like protein
MNISRLVLWGSFLIFLSSAVLAAEVQTLEAAFENVIDRLNAHDQEGFLKGWHPEAVLIVYDYLFPVDRSDAGDEVWAQIFSDFFSKAKITITPVDVDSRVVGETGLVWGMTQTMVEPTQGNREVQDLRVSATFVETGGTWKLISWHSSLPPERNRGVR